ncbi:MAG: hypothetical protein COX20_11445 [Desulfobacterales bacterium CG23_combo_of_CG06-09_8_20_14_all_52_9]|nr:MAG: hypothetical protein COX20_11445 [Desulfobacterales bacterium CG23_combo_of_CG06-09_8_20_14_all_52_9]
MRIHFRYFTQGCFESLAWPLFGIEIPVTTRYQAKRIDKKGVGRLSLHGHLFKSMFALCLNESLAGGTAPG